MNRFLSFALLGFLSMANQGCDVSATADHAQTEAQEQLMSEAVAQTGVPAIKNFRERKLLKDILELRDQDGLTTYTYIVAEMTGKLVFLGESIGYGIPAATQYTSPMRPAHSGETHESGNLALPQADPNGLFSPASADGTWVMMLDPTTRQTRPVYIEPRIIVSPFKLPQ